MAPTWSNQVSGGSNSQWSSVAAISSGPPMFWDQVVEDKAKTTQKKNNNNQQKMKSNNKTKQVSWNCYPVKLLICTNRKSKQIQTLKFDIATNATV